jgi:hypothetical protein
MYLLHRGRYERKHRYLAMKLPVLLIYSVSVMMMDNKFMKSLDSFKNFMSGNDVPNYVKRYCGGLDEFKWQWFYFEMKETIEFVTDIDCLFYILKWILKHDFDDLAYEVFFQEIMDPECRPKSLIKDEWWDILQARYKQRLAEDIPDIHYDRNDPAVSDAVEE